MEATYGQQDDGMVVLNFASPRMMLLYILT